MGILFAVLKIIGIILLVIVAIVAVILFAPFVYEADGSSEKKNAHIKVRWLFGFLRFRFSHEHHSSAFALHILSFQILPRGSSAEKRRKKYHFRKKEDPVFSYGEIGEKEPESSASEGPFDGIAGQEEKSPEPESRREASIHVSAPPLQESSHSEREMPAWKKYGTASGRKNVSRKFRKYKKGSFGRKGSGRRVKGQDGFASTLRRGIRIFREYRQKELFQRLFRVLMQFLMRVRPRILNGNITFGFDNPALTGRVLGAVSMVPFIFQTDLQIQPDFETEKAYFQGEVYLKGHIQLIFVLILFLRLLRNKDFRSFLSKARNIR